MTRIPINVRPAAQNTNDIENDFQNGVGAMTMPPNERPAGADDGAATESGGDSEVPDPTVAPDGDTTPEPSGEPPASDPTVPPASQPIEGSAGNRIMNSAGEIAGPGGAGVTGGELTNPQDAEKAVQKNIDSRTEEQEMFRRQMEGEVGTQTQDLKPSPAHPEEGLPTNPTGKESTGGADETATEDGDGGTSASGSDSAAVGASTEGASTEGASTEGASTADSSVASASDSGPSAGSVTRAVGEGDDRFLQLAADFENFKRQAARRESETRERATRGVIEDLLPVLDNFERALDAAKNARDVESVRVGVEFIAQQLRDALKTHGVEPIQAQGQPFDPLHHEALEEVSNSEHPEGTVVEEAQRGYSFKGQVLRPSLVRVAGK